MITRKYLNSVLRIPDDPVPPPIYIDAPSHPKPHTKIIIDEYTGRIPFGEVINPRNTNPLTSNFEYQGYQEIMVEIKGVSGTITDADVGGVVALENISNLSGGSDNTVLTPTSGSLFPYGQQLLTINYNDDVSGNPNTLTLDVYIAPFDIDFSAPQNKELEEKYNIKCEIANIYKEHEKQQYIDRVNKMFTETVSKWDPNVVTANCDLPAPLIDPADRSISQTLSEIKAAHNLSAKDFLVTEKIDSYLPETDDLSVFESELQTVEGIDKIFNKLSDNHNNVIQYMMDKQKAKKQTNLKTWEDLTTKYTDVINNLELINKGLTTFDTQITTLKNKDTFLKRIKKNLDNTLIKKNNITRINYQQGFINVKDGLTKIEEDLTTNTESVIEFMNGNPPNAYSDKLTNIKKIDTVLVEKINDIRQDAVTAVKKQIEQAIVRGNALKANIATLKAIVSKIVRVHNPDTTVFPLPTYTELDDVYLIIDTEIDKLQASQKSLTENNFNPKLDYDAIITAIEPKYDDKNEHENKIKTYLNDELHITDDLYAGNIVTKITEANIQKAKTLLEKQQNLLETLKNVVPKINDLKFIKEKNEARSNKDKTDSVQRSDVLNPDDLNPIEEQINKIKSSLESINETDDGTAQIKQLNGIIPDAVKNPINTYLASSVYDTYTVDSENINDLNAVLTEEIKTQEELFKEQDKQTRVKLRLLINISTSINKYIAKIKNTVKPLNDKITEYNTKKISGLNLSIVEPGDFEHSNIKNDKFKSETREKVLKWTNDIQSRVISTITNRSNDTSELLNALSKAITAYKNTTLTDADSEKTELNKLVKAVGVLVNSLISDIDTMIKEAALQLTAKKLEVEQRQQTISDINNEVTRYNEKSIKDPIDLIQETALITGGSTNQKKFKNYTEYLTNNNISDPSTTVVSFIDKIKGKGNDENTLPAVVDKQLELDELELKNKQQELETAKKQLQADREALKSYVEKSIYFDDLQIEDPVLQSDARTKREQYTEVQENITKIKNLNLDKLRDTISAKHGNQTWSTFTKACDGAIKLEEDELQQVQTTADGLKEEATNSIKRYLNGTSATLIEYNDTLQVIVPPPEFDKTDSNKKKYEKYVQYKNDIETRIKEIKYTIFTEVKNFTDVQNVVYEDLRDDIGDFINGVMKIETQFLTTLKQEANKLIEQFELNKAALKKFTDVTPDSNLKQLNFSDDLNNRVQSLVKKIKEELKKYANQTLSSDSLPNNPSRYSKEEFKAYTQIMKLLGPDKNDISYISDITYNIPSYSKRGNFKDILNKMTSVAVEEKEKRKKQEALEERKKQKELEQEKKPSRKTALPPIKNLRVSTPPITGTNTGKIPFTPDSDEESEVDSDPGSDFKNAKSSRGRVINIQGKGDSPSSTFKTTVIRRKQEKKREQEEKEEKKETKEDDVDKILKDQYKVNIKGKFTKKNKRSEYKEGDFVKLVRFKEIHYGWIIEILRLQENKKVKAKNNTDTVSILSPSEDVFVKKTLPWHDRNNSYQISKYQLEKEQSNTIKDYVNKIKDTILSEENIFQGSIEEVTAANREYTIGQKIEELGQESDWEIATWKKILKNGKLVKFKYNSNEVIGCVFARYKGVIKMEVYQSNNNDIKKKDVYEIKLAGLNGNADTAIDFNSFKLYIPKKKLADNINNAVNGYAQLFSKITILAKNKITVSYPAQTPPPVINADEMELESVGGSPDSLSDIVLLPPKNPPSSPSSPPSSPSAGTFRPRMQMSPRRAPQVLDVGSSIQLRF